MPLTIATLWRLAPYIGGALLFGGTLWWAYDNGRDTERAKWKQREAVAVEAARARESALQAQVDAAGAALSMSTAEIERLAAAQRMTTRNYYHANPAADVQCLGPDRVRAVQASDKALDVASAAR